MFKGSIVCFCLFVVSDFSCFCPKVLTGAGYTQKADLWSAGVIAFMLLCGSFPFLKDEADLNDKVYRCRLLAFALIVLARCTSGRSAWGQ